jgi:transcriptional regulator with XRE-family HTH domain
MPVLFGAKLQHLRLQHNMTQRGLAEKLGFSTHATVSHLETGRNAPSLALALRIAALFEVSLDYLLRDTISIESPSSERAAGSHNYSFSLVPFARNIRRLRQERGLTQRQLALDLGLEGHQHIGNLELGRKEPSVELALSIADLFGVSLQDLVTTSILE